MRKRTYNRFDRALTGFTAGFLIPVILFFLVFWFGERDVSFADYIRNMWKLHALVKLMSLCVFTNILVFYGFIRLKYDRAARGVLGATILYAFAVLLSRAF